MKKLLYYSLAFIFFFKSCANPLEVPCKKGPQNIVYLVSKHELIDENGIYNRKGKVCHENLARIKMDSDLNKNKKQKSCDTCPLYPFTNQHHEILKNNKHKFTPEDQEIIDELEPFYSHQQCMLNQMKELRNQHNWLSYVYPVGTYLALITAIAGLIKKN